jgi:hypothetical protein
LVLTIVDVDLTQFQAGVERWEAQEQQEDARFTSSRVQAGAERNEQNAQNNAKRTCAAQHYVIQPLPHLQVQNLHFSILQLNCNIQEE